MIRFTGWRPLLAPGSVRLVVLMLLVPGALGACGVSELPVPVAVPTPTPFVVDVVTEQPSPTPVPEPVRLRYALWDANQAPAYAACADQFMVEHPYVTIEIEQTDEARYWDKLRAEMASGAAPDVFVNHLTQLPDLAAADRLIDLEPLVRRDGLDDQVYIGRLPRMWMRAGIRYGWPKDWDTVALVYNLDLLTASGVAASSLTDLTWNPEDGGAFEEVLARLSLDAEGNSGLSPDFDPAKVTRYGMTMAGVDGGGAFGQTQWSGLAASNGFRFTDYMFAEYYRYDDPVLSQTFQWYQRLIDELGYHAPFAEIAERDGRQIFLDGEAALIADGSWMIRTYVDEAPFAVGFAPLPTGPHGRKSMFNGLADSIWAGSAHPEIAWQWVKHLGSVDCQLLVGEQGIVFPAMQSGIDRMVAHYDALGVNVRAYTAYLEEDGGDTFFFPVTEHVQEVEAIMRPVIESIWRNEADPAVVLPEANARVNALFED